MDTSLRVKRRHKVWPEALKREIVAACLAPGASVSMVARQYDANANMVFEPVYGDTDAYPLFKAVSKMPPYSVDARHSAVFWFFASFALSGVLWTLCPPQVGTPMTAKEIGPAS
jgi:hypothetical protein